MKLMRFSGLLGLVLLLFGIVGTSFLSAYTRVLGAPYMVALAHIILGIALIVIWFVQGGIAALGNAGQAITGRAARFGANAVFAFVVFVGFLIAANWFANRYDKRIDLTHDQVYSLSQQSVDLVRNLKKPLKIIGFDLNLEDDEAPRDLLRRYQEQNPSLVSTEFIDPRSKPHLVDKYGIKPGNQVYIEFGEGEKAAVSRINEFNEEAITNAVIKLARGEARKIYYVVGHEEPDIKSGAPGDLQKLAASIEDEHLTMDKLILSQAGKVPDDAAAVMLVSPKKPLLPEEKDILVKYAEAGGSLMLFHDPRTTTDIKDLANHFGIKVGDDVIIDKIQRLFSAPELGAQPIVTTYGAHPITRNMNDQTITIYNIASSVTPTGKNTDKVTYTELAKTGASAWAETNLTALFSEPPAATKDDNDLAGPVSVAVAYEKKLSDTPPADKDKDKGASFQKVSRVVVFGDSDWVLNANLHVYANRDFVLNAINWLVGEEGGITLRPKQMKESGSPIPIETFMLILVSSFLVPELILLFGLFTWWRRRTLSVA